MLSHTQLKTNNIKELNTSLSLGFPTTRTCEITLSNSKWVTVLSKSNAIEMCEFCSLFSQFFNEVCLEAPTQPIEWYLLKQEWYFFELMKVWEHYQCFTNRYTTRHWTAVHHYLHNDLFVTNTNKLPVIWSCDTGQQIPCFDNCQLTITWMSNIKDAPMVYQKL